MQTDTSDSFISQLYLSPPTKCKHYVEFKIGVLLRQAREEAGLTQEEVAQKLNTKKSAISRMENHAEDVRLSTLGKYAKVLGKKLYLSVG